MPPTNPLDIWPAVERSGPERVFQVCFEALMEDPNVDGVHAHLFAGRMMEADLDFLEPCRNADKPVAVWPVGDSRLFREMRETIESYGVPVFYEVQRGVRALQALAEIRGASKNY